MADQRVSVGGAPTRCPYCKDELDSSRQELVGCADCGARQHGACHEQHGSCAACGSAKALYPRRRPATPRGPLAGSKIAVAAEGETTTYTWPKHQLSLPGQLVMWLIVLCLPPVWILLLVARLKETPEATALRKAKTATLALTPGALELTVTAASGQNRERVRIARDELAAPPQVI